jgi:hypothetical protein
VIVSGEQNGPWSRTRWIPYLFKLKQSANVKKLIEKFLGRHQWVEARQQWQGLETELRLSGGSKARRVVLLWRRLSEPPEESQKSKRKATQQLSLDLPEASYQGARCEYAVLVTALQDEVRTIAQH